MYVVSMCWVGGAPTIDTAPSSSTSTSSSMGVSMAARSIRIPISRPGATRQGSRSATPAKTISNGWSQSNSIAIAASQLPFVRLGLLGVQTRLQRHRIERDLRVEQDLHRVDQHGLVAERHREV